MTSSVTARRRVRCPKCTATLAEPQAQIYECPICSTYLVAKGHGASKTAAKSLNVDGGDAEEAQESADGGGKLEMAGLSGNDPEPLQGESENSRDFERENASESDAHAASDSRSQSLAKDGLLQSGYSRSDIHLEKSGDLSPTPSSPPRSSDLDSDLPSESEADSPLLSPKDVTISEGPQVSSFVQSSSDLMTSTVTGSCIERQREKRDTQKDAKNGDKQQTPAQQAHHAEVVADNIEDNCDKQQILARHRDFSEESAENKEVGGVNCRTFDEIESRTASKTGSDTALRKIPPKKTVKGVDLQHNSDSKEKAAIGKFQLFDLSVFGIYNEDTYNELRRGKVADDQRVTGKNVNGNTNQPPHMSESSKLLKNKKSFQNASNKIVSRLDTITGASKLAVPGDGIIYTRTGDNSDTHVNASNKDTRPRRLNSFLREADDAGIGSPLPIFDRDIDALAKARYGDDLGVSELSPESADISFGDWRPEHPSKSSTKVLQLGPKHENHGKGAMNPATEADADSSCDENEELTFLSTAKGGFKSEETVVRNGNDGSLAKNTVEKPAFASRMTDMKQYTGKDDQQSASQAQSFETVIKSDSVLCEASCVEHYSSHPVSATQEALDQAPQPTLVLEDNAPLMRELESRVEGLKLEHTENETEFQRQSIPQAHGSLSSMSIKRLDVLAASECSKEDRRQAPFTNNGGSRRGFEPVAILQEDGISWKTSSTSPKTGDFVSQKLRHFNQPNPKGRGSLAGAPVALKRGGKRNGIPSASSTEDEAAYSGSPEKDPYREGSLVLNGLPYPEREGRHGLHEESRETLGRVSGTGEQNRQKFGSEQPLISSRTGRSRPSNKMLSTQGPLIGEDRFHAEEKSLGSEASEWIGLGNQRDKPSYYLGTGLNMSRGGLDQMSHHGSPGNIATGYGSDRPSRSQEIPSHYSGHIDYMPKPRGSSLSASAREYPFHVPTYDPAALTASHEEVHALPLHAHHHGISPACPVCVQQHYYLHHSQIHQNIMMHQCAACAAQALVACQPMHHEIHGCPMHSSMHLNHSQRHSGSIPDSFVLPAESTRQSRPHVQHDHLNMSGRRTKCYPPLPGKGSPPYVLCRHCHQLLQVPEHLPTVSGSIQKLHCDACGKTSKFSILQPESPGPSSSMVLSDRNNFLEMDKEHIDISHVNKSGQSSSSGVVPSAQNLFGEARLVPGQGTKQAWIEKAEILRSNAHGVSLTQPNVAGHQSRIKSLAAATGSGQAAYKSRHINGTHASNDAGRNDEDDFSSSASSASDSSPERLSQLSQGKQPAQTFVTGRTSRDQNYLTISRPSAPHNQGIFPPKALSFSEGPNQRVAIENQIRVSRPSLQVSVPEPFGNSSQYAPLERHDNDPSSAIWHSELPDGNYSHSDSPRNYLEQVHKVAVASGSPRLEHITHGMVNDVPSARHRQLHSISGNDLRSAPRSPKVETRASPHDSYSHRDSQGRLVEVDHPSQLPLHDSAKGPMLFAGLLKRSIKDRGKGGQQGGNHRKVIVNGFLISEAAVVKAEDRAGPIHSGTYWYDYQAGFWGVLGGPCLGILMPFIEEFHFPLARDCAGGKTGILVNGRELHNEDLEVLAKRGLPTTPGKAYILDIRGALFDDWSGQHLKGLGKLAPSIEKRGRGFGMSPSMPMG